MSEDTQVPTAPKPRFLFPQGIGRKFVVAYTVVVGYLVHVMLVTWHAFARMEFSDALAVAQANGEQLGEMAMIAFGAYVLVKAATDTNGSRA